MFSFLIHHAIWAEQHLTSPQATDTEPESTLSPETRRTRNRATDGLAPCSPDLNIMEKEDTEAAEQLQHVWNKLPAKYLEKTMHKYT